MRNPKKFGSPKLDTPSSRYHFSKLAQKSRKEINKTLTVVANAWDPGVSGSTCQPNRNRGASLTGASLLTVSFPVKPTPQSCFSHSPASTGIGGGSADAPERAHRRPWRHGGAAWRCAGCYWPWQGLARSTWAPR